MSAPKNPLLLDFPLPLRTERLTLRSIMPGDGPQVFEAIRESYDQFRQWLPWCRTLPTPETTEETARKFYADFILKKALHFVLFEKEHLIGMSSYTFHWEIPSADLGYWCRTSCQGKGYMREAVSAMTRYAFSELGLQRLSLLCDDENRKSIALAEHLNFALETRAKGLLPDPEGKALRLGRRYVRFDAENLPQGKNGPSVER